MSVLFGIYFLWKKSLKIVEEIVNILFYESITTCIFWATIENETISLKINNFSKLRKKFCLNAKQRYEKYFRLKDMLKKYTHLYVNSYKKDYFVNK